MLSITSVKTSGQASSYYENSDYYSAENDHAEFNGLTMDELNISNEFNKDTFHNLLNGTPKDGVELGRINKNGEREHRAGWDFTFSAPKSVSLMALVGGDERLIEAHRKASDSAMKWLESEFATVRVPDGNGGSNYETTGNLAWASFVHGTSRLLDPQLHSHNFIFNISRDKDGDFRSLETKPMYENKMKAGALYRSELANELLSLGYKLDFDFEKKQFEIASIAKEVLKTFSQRSEVIKKIAESVGIDSSKGKESISVNSRDKKVKTDGVVLSQVWKEKALDLNFNTKELIDESFINGSLNEKSLSNALRNVKISIDHASQFEAAFTRSDIVDFTLSHSFGSCSLEEINLAVDKLVSEETIHISRYDDNFLTTKNGIRIENNIGNLLSQGEGYFKKGIVNKRTASAYLKSFNQESKALGHDGLLKGQEESFNHIMQSKDQFIGVQGYAGVGKTFLLEKVNKCLVEHDYVVTGLSQSKSAVDNLQHESGIKSQTIDSFLLMKESNEKNQIWIVDEHGMTSNRVTNELMFKARKAGARVVFLGDVEQQGSIEAGRAFKLMQELGMKTSVMKDIIRQKFDNERDAVYRTIDRDYEGALQNLDERVFESSNLNKVINEQPYQLKKNSKLTSGSVLQHNETGEQLFVHSANENGIHVSPLDAIDFNSIGKKVDAQDGIKGKLLDFGHDNFNHDKKKSSSFFVKLEMNSGKAKDIWSADLARHFEGGAYSVGDSVVLKHEGKAPVVTTDEKGNKVSTHVNKWHVSNHLNNKIDYLSSVDKKTIPISMAKNNYAHYEKNNKKTSKSINHESMVDDWANQHKSERDNSLIIIPDNKTKQAATGYLREKLKGLGELGKEDHELVTLKQNQMSDTQKRHFKFYEKGMVIEFNHDYEKIGGGVKQGDKYIITGKDHNTQLLTLSPLANVDLKKLSTKEERFKSHYGKLLSHGPANFNEQSNKKQSYFIEIETPNGETKKIWSQDFERAIGNATIGEKIEIKHEGLVPVKVQNEKGVWVDGHRNSWSVNEHGVKDSDIEAASNVEGVIQWDTSKAAANKVNGLSVFNLVTKGVSQNDKIRFTSKDKKHDVNNNDKAVVQSIDNNSITLKLADGSVKSMSINEAMKIDHDHIMTAFSSQGLGEKNVFMLTESWRRNLINHKSFYVMLSRAKEKINIYTDSKDKLIAALKERTGEKESALEHSMRGFEKEPTLSKVQQTEMENKRIVDFFKSIGSKARSLGERKPQERTATNIKPKTHEVKIIHEQQTRNQHER